MDQSTQFWAPHRGGKDRTFPGRPAVDGSPVVAGFFEEMEKHASADPVRLSYALRIRGFSASPRVPTNLGWMLHVVTQLSAGRVARRWVNRVR
jgi:hypothetical protein